MKKIIDNTSRYARSRIGGWNINNKLIELPAIAGVSNYNEHTGVDYDILLDNIDSQVYKKYPDKIYFLFQKNPLINERMNEHIGQNVSKELTEQIIVPIVPIIPGNIDYPECFTNLDLTMESILPEMKSNINNSVKLHNDQYNVEIINENNQPVSQEHGIIFLLNSLKLISTPKKFVKRVISSMPRSNWQKILFIPGIATVNNLAILIYIGGDLFDNIQCILHARNGYLMTNIGSIHFSNVDRNMCYCPGCLKMEKLIDNTVNNEPKFQSNDRNILFNCILEHNEYSLLSELSLIKTSIRTGNLRHLVEQRMVTEPTLSSIIRILDLDYYTELERYFPIQQKGSFPCVSREALYRVEVKRFRERIVNRYKKPEEAKILILLPCSAKKPYSTSKSHRLFTDAIEQAINGNMSMEGHSNIIHKVIVTSPLGLVPEELELVFPAQQYDIPVTGNWFEDELKMISSALINLLLNNRYEHIIIHLNPPLNTFLKHCIKNGIGQDINVILTNQSSTTEYESLNNLTLEVTKLINKYLSEKPKKPNIPNIPNIPITQYSRILSGIARYQFGEPGIKLLQDCKIKGKYPYLKIFRSNTQLGMLTGERGLISLTLSGAEQMMMDKDFEYTIKIDDFKPKGSIMSVGVTEASDIIRVGDEVIAEHSGELRAVGQAMMSGPEMVVNNRGVAIKVRHHC